MNSAPSKCARSKKLERFRVSGRPFVPASVGTIGLHTHADLWTPPPGSGRGSGAGCLAQKRWSSGHSKASRESFSLADPGGEKIQHHPRWRITICCQPRWANYPANWAIKKEPPRITNRIGVRMHRAERRLLQKHLAQNVYEYRGARTRACRVHTRVNARSQDEINSPLSILTTACTLHAADAALTPRRTRPRHPTPPGFQKEFLALVDGLTMRSGLTSQPRTAGQSAKTAEHIMLGEALLFASVQTRGRFSAQSGLGTKTRAKNGVSGK